MSQPNTFFSKKIQEIHVEKNGKVTHSSNTIFDISQTDNLYELHPFFESLAHELEHSDALDRSLAFPCVQLEINNKEAICDITIKKERGFLAILLFDYSQHYEHLHEAAQEKKSALLIEQKHQLQKEHLSEKKAYLDFIRQRIDVKIIAQMEHIVKSLETIKKTELSAEQRNMLQQVEEGIGNFHLKAIQIREELDFDFDS